MKKYSLSHEWVELQDGYAIIGITQKAAQEIGEIVFVELPCIGQEVQMGQEIVVVESTKAAIDICSPISGIIQAVNEALIADVSLINGFAEKEGWLFRLQPSDIEEFEQLHFREDGNDV